MYSPLRLADALAIAGINLICLGAERRVPKSDFDRDQFVLTAFAYLAEDERRLMGLLDLCGLTPQAAKTALQTGDDGLRAHVADYLLSDERWAQGYAQHYGLSPEDLHALALAAGHQPLMS